MADLLEIGNLVKRTRRERRWSRSTLAARSGVSLARIEALENKRAADIGFKKVTRLLQALGLDLRVTTLNLQRPTLEDLTAEEDTQHDPRMGR